MCHNNAPRIETGTLHSGERVKTAGFFPKAGLLRWTAIRYSFAIDGVD